METLRDKPLSKGQEVLVQVTMINEFMSRTGETEVMMPARIVEPVCYPLGRIGELLGVLGILKPKAKVELRKRPYVGVRLEKRYDNIFPR